MLRGGMVRSFYHVLIGNCFGVFEETLSEHGFMDNVIVGEHHRKFFYKGYFDALWRIVHNNGTQKRLALSVYPDPGIKQ
jgi:hypothetical protein